MADFLFYVWSLIWSWLGLLAGGAGAAVALYEKAKKQELHPRRYLGILVVFLVVAGFSAWYEEQKKSAALTGQLAEMQQEAQRRLPNIRVTVEDMTAGRMPGTPPNDSVVMLYLTVKNIGQMPSVVDRYLLKVDVLNRPTVRAENVPASDAEVVQPSEGKPVTVSRLNLIYLKTLRPIAPGAMERGVMIFYVRGVSEQEIVDSVCTLSWRDVLDRSSSLTAKIHKPPPGWEPPFIPGIEEEPLPSVSPTGTPK